MGLYNIIPSKFFGVWVGIFIWDYKLLRDLVSQLYTFSNILNFSKSCILEILWHK